MVRFSVEFLMINFVSNIENNRKVCYDINVVDYRKGFKNMKDLKLNITINKPVEEVFAFATNSSNISLWYPTIKEEIPSEVKWKLGTRIKNRGDDVNDWGYYEITEFETNKKFTLSEIGNPYHVRYTFLSIGNSTNLEYYEWVDSGEISEPASIENLELLKKCLEENENY